MSSPMYSQVRFKASHNSYARSELPVTDQLVRPPAVRPYQAGCRGLELDLIESDRLWHWSDKHDGTYNGGVDGQLASYLRHLRLWSKRHAGHDVITITLDLKSKTKSLQDFAYHLDATIAEHLGEELLFTPGALQGTHKDLVAGAVANGWPSLDELSGTFILCLSGDEGTKKRYVGSRARLAFADRKIGVSSSLPNQRTGDRVFLNFDIAEGGWQAKVRETANRPAFVSRVYLVNDEQTWARAVRARANLIATDKIRNHPWATVGPASLFMPF